METEHRRQVLHLDSLIKIHRLYKLPPRCILGLGGYVNIAKKRKKIREASSDIFIDLQYRDHAKQPVYYTTETLEAFLMKGNEVKKVTATLTPMTYNRPFTKKKR